MNVFEHVKQGYTFNDFYLKPSKSKAESRRDLSVESHLTPGLLFDFPVIPANMASISGSKMAVALLQSGGTCCLHRFLTPEKLIEELKFIRTFQSNEGMLGSRDFANKSMTVGISLGTNPKSNSEFLSILNKYSGLWNSIGYIIIDVAHGHHSNVISTIETLVSYFEKNNFDSHVFPPKIIAGNICTAYAAKELSLYPIDGLKVGIGPGSMCKTRTATGIGCPQLTAIQDVHNALIEVGKRDKINIIADGGFKEDGDFVKALAAGSDFCMSGSIFAGTNETPGNIISVANGDMVKIYEGMASVNAQVNQFGKEAEDVISEGVTTFVPYKGRVSRILKRVKGHIQSGMSYCGVDSIKELQEYGSNPDNWIKVTTHGYVEGTPHGS